MTVKEKMYRMKKLMKTNDRKERKHNIIVNK